MEFHLGIAMRHQNWESSLSKGKPKTLGEGKIRLGSPSSGLDLRRSQREFGWNFEWMEHLYGFRQLGWKGNPWCGHSQKKTQKNQETSFQGVTRSSLAASSRKSSQLHVFPFPTPLTFKNNSKAERFFKPSHPKKSEPPTAALPASARRDFQVFLWLHKVGIRGIFPQELRRKERLSPLLFLRVFFWNFAPFIWGRRIKITPGFGSFFP